MLDIVGWVPDCPKNPYYIVLVGEIKARREKNSNEVFTDDEKGKLESFLETVLEYQLDRKHITGNNNVFYIIYIDNKIKDF